MQKFFISLFWESGEERIKIYSLKSRGGLWLSHAQPNQQLNLLMTTAKTIEAANSELNWRKKNSADRMKGKNFCSCQGELD
jgi:hypothetical protein